MKILNTSIGFLLLFLASLAISGGIQSGIERENIDPAIRPQDDLYMHVNGKWLERTEIPADKSNFGAFMELIVQNENRLRQIIEQSANTDSRGEETEMQQVGDFYLSFMDTVTIDKLQLQPLQEDIQRINQITKKSDLVQLVAYFIKIGVTTPVFYYINQDEKQSDRYIGYLYQSGLGLPDRDYYFKNEDKFVEIRNKYQIYMENLLTLAQVEEASTKAARIMEMETSLAQGHWTQVENRDREKSYNKFSISQLNQLTPAFSWSDYIREAGIADCRELIINQPSYLEQLEEVLKQYPVSDWRAYFTVRLLHDMAPYLNQPFVDLNFDFTGQVLSGIEQNSPRWKRAVNIVNSSMGEAVGELYVEKHFQSESKERMIVLVENLRKAYAQRIARLDWMTPHTRTKALEKLSKFRAKIGYPDKWKDYSGLVIEKDQLVKNIKRANQITYKREIAKLGKPIDREEWFMTPQTVNAYYNPTMNEVVFPAAILQPPFFNLEADDAVNYGAIGAGIGHEMTHGFDDQGRKSDGDGNLRDWWTENDARRFEEKAQVLVNQFNQYVPIDTFRINGELTLGENIADLGGLTIAFRAYQLSLNGKPSEEIDGLTGEQRFFLGWGQIWRRKYRDVELRKRLLTDPHSPSQYRVNGAVVNMPEFYQTFQVSETDQMYIPEEERLQIW